MHKSTRICKTQKNSVDVAQPPLQARPPFSKPTCKLDYIIPMSAAPHQKSWLRHLGDGCGTKFSSIQL